LNLPILINDLKFKFSEKSEYLLNGINLEVNKGEVVAIVGYSGIGKSTLCYCISGIIPNIKKGLMSGEVLINGVSTKKMNISEISQSLGIVFQNPDTQLFSPTVEDEIAFGPENFGVLREEIEKRISESLEIVGMSKHRLKNPKKLSGGEKQLIALASVLSLKPEILIFDEVMSQLDNDSKTRIKNLILKLKKEGKSIVMVEHDFDNLDVAERVLCLNNGILNRYNDKILEI
jgi:energy-coupling factor transport system ATP-binding protein